jgi:enoyl-CoA hydratase/carnithine racemase
MLAPPERAGSTRAKRRIPVAAYETVQYEKADKKAVILLNRPEKLNAFNVQMIHELRAIWQDIADDDDVWTIILSGNGRGFCSGIDLAGEGWSGIRHWKDQGERLHDPGFFLSPKSLRLFKPVVVAVNGVCAGGGFYFVNEADVLICSENASFTEPHTSHGLTAAVEMVGLSWRVPVGYALRMGLLGRHERMTPEQALKIGLVTEVVPQERLLARAHEIADTINLNSPLASRATVETMWRSKDMTRAAALEFAYTMAIYHNGMSADYDEGKKAFLEKRPPRWSGR